MNLDNPEIKPTLRFYPSADHDDKVVVNDPASGRYFQLDYRAADIARQLDGRRTIDEIALLNATQHKSISTDQVRGVIEQLHKLGCLVGSSPKSPKRQSLLAYRISLTNPDRLFEWLHKYIGLLFTPFVLIPATVSIIISAILVFTISNQWMEPLKQPFGLKTGLTIYLPALLTMVIHELGHGLACKHFGGRVRDIGLIFYYFQPCTYVDVSDSWMLPRTQRIIIMAAGIFTEAIIWSIAVFVAWRMPPHTPIAAIAAGIVATSGLKSLFNLNPLIKLDGYYILSDLINIPNLRQTAFSLLKRHHTAAFPNRFSRTQRIVLWIYLPLSLLFSIGVIVLSGYFFYMLLTSWLF